MKPLEKETTPAAGMQYFASSCKSDTEQCVTLASERLMSHEANHATSKTMFDSGQPSPYEKLCTY